MASFTPAWGGWWMVVVDGGGWWRWWMVVEVSELVGCVSVVSLNADQPTVDAHHRVALRNQVLHVNAFTALKEGHGGGVQQAVETAGANTAAAAAAVVVVMVAVKVGANVPMGAEFCTSGQQRRALPRA